MATWEVRYGSDSNTWLTVTATESDVNVANNTSKVTVKVELVSKTTYTAWNGYSQSLSVKVDGSTIGSRTFTYNLAGNARVTLGTYSRTVTHNSDGSKTSAIVVSASGGGDSGTISKSLGLTTIARATNPTLSKTSTPLGSAITINLPRASSSFTHDIRYSFAGLSGQTSGIATPNGATTSTTFTPPASLASRIPNSTSNGGVLSITTKNGSTVIGTKNISFSITIPDNSTYNPTLSSLKATEQNTAISSGMPGVWVQGYSQIRITATVGLKYGATVRTARVYIGGAWREARSSGTSFNIHENYIPTTSGSHTYKAEIVDSRGRTTSASGSLTVTDYKKPRLVISANRNEDNATKISVGASTTASSMSSKNVTTMELYIKKLDESGWGTAKKTESTTGALIDWGIVDFEPYSETSSYEVMVRVKDKLTNWSNAIIQISTSAVLMDVYKDAGISIGKMYDEALGGALQVGGNIHVSGGIETNFISRKLPTGTNLNNIIESGFYYNDSNNDVKTMHNVPVPFAFSLFVERHAGHKQTLTSFRSDSPRTFIRNQYNGTWGEWHEVFVSMNYSNSNGHVIRTAEGLQICTGKFLFKVTDQDTYVVLPASFANTDFAISFSSGNGNWNTTEDVEKIGAGPGTTGSMRFRKAGTLTFSTPSGAIPISYSAIGRWK